MKFVRIWIPEFAVALPAQIQHKIDTNPQPPEPMTDFAEVLYHAFRCGILHDAHVTPYGMVRSGTQLLRFEPNGFTTYTAGGDCPTVLIDPWRFRDRVHGVFNDYLDRVLDMNPAHNVIRVNFKAKFTESFGVDVTAAV